MEFNSGFKGLNSNNNNIFKVYCLLEYDAVALEKISQKFGETAASVLRLVLKKIRAITFQNTTVYVIITPKI